MNTPMPEAIDVWLFKDDVEDCWKAEVAGRFDDVESKPGPHKIVPGMMGLDELAEHGIFIEYLAEQKVWHVYPGPTVAEGSCFDTALEAQWAATCLARGDLDE